jgi:hypothetical protein
MRVSTAPLRSVSRKSPCRIPLFPLTQPLARHDVAPRQATLRVFSSSPPRVTVTESISAVVKRMRELVAQEREGYVEGDVAREKGLRMLMFGKPGSGKVSRLYANHACPGIRHVTSSADVQGDAQCSVCFFPIAIKSWTVDMAVLKYSLLKLYDIAFVSTGDVLRKEIAAKTPLGLRAEEVVRTGGTPSCAPRLTGFCDGVQLSLGTQT